MEYLGHIISRDDIRPQSSKIKAIMEMSDPQNKKELCSFLEMVKYYDRFSPGLATKCSILNDLLKKGLT